MMSCGNKNPEVRCKQMQCVDCNKLDLKAKRDENYQEELMGLPSIKPPQFPGFVSNADFPGNNPLEEFLNWFAEFSANIGTTPTINEWNIIKMKIRELKE
jgi:hypothetical protein